MPQTTLVPLSAPCLIDNNVGHLIPLRMHLSCNQQVLNPKVYTYLSIAAAPASAAASPISHGTMVVLLDLDDDGVPINESADNGAAVMTSETQKNDNGFAAALACYPYSPFP